MAGSPGSSPAGLGANKAWNQGLRFRDQPLTYFLAIVGFTELGIQRLAAVQEGCPWNSIPANMKEDR